MVKRHFSLLLLLSTTVFAQSFSGSIQGTVRDPSGSSVAGAAVEVVNTATNTHTEVKTDGSGTYVAPLLPPGSYSVQISSPGFKKFTRSEIVLQVQQQARIDVVLTVGELTESVVVTANASMLETSTSSIGKVVDNRNIMDLPLNTRNVYSLIYLAPGITGTIGNNYNSLSYSINGGRSSFADTIIDGVTASHPTVQGYSGITVFPSVDAIAEFKVQSATLSAEFGRSAGGLVNVIFKSGANELHGSAYEFLRNSALDSNDFFNNRAGKQLASFKRSQFGGMVSGPIRRDKTFFMGSYEGLRQRNFASLTSTVPTTLERQGDFSRTYAANGQQIRIFDPFTTRAAPSGGGYIRDVFAGNVIPASSLDPVALNAIKYYPQSNAPGLAVTGAQNFYNQGMRTLNTDNYDVRVDHSFTTSQKFFTRYSRRYVQDTPPVYFPKDLTIAEGRIIQENRVHNAVADYTHTLSPTTVLNARLGFARTLFVYSNQGYGFLPSSLGLPKSIDQAVDTLMFPLFNPSGYQNLGGGDNRGNAFMTYSLNSSLTRVMGAHTLKIGWDGRLIRVNNYEALSAGMFEFSTAMTQGPNPSAASSTAGNSMASMLLGTGMVAQTTNNRLVQGWKQISSQSFYHGFYFQDDWHVTSRLTFNLGIRYDLETPRTERHDRMNYFDPTAVSPLAAKVSQFPDLRGGLVFVGVNGVGRSQFSADRNNLAPRLGLAFQLLPQTVVRAAYGHLYGVSPQSAHGNPGNMGFRVDNQWVTSLDGITPYNLLRNPYPLGFQPPPGATSGLLTQAGANIDSVLQDSPTPWNQQWSFSLQHELRGNMLVDLSYIGLRGLQLARNGNSGMNINQLSPQYLSLGSKLNELVDNPFYGVVNNGVLVAKTISRAQLLRPYPQFTDILPLYSSGSSSFYHSFQATLTKRLSHGMQFDAAYTWAKNIDDGQSHQNSYDARADRALADIDVAHRVVLSYVVELPFGSGRRYLSHANPAVVWLLGGWQLNGITTLQSGTPLALTASNTAGLLNPKTRPNNNGQSARLTGDVESRLSRYFNTSVFSQPAPFTFGNLGERLPDVRNDGLENFDISLFKEFHPVERVRIQFRAEALNAFNSPRFGSPGLSVTSTTFGVISTQANDPRQVQFGLKVLW